MPFISSFDVTIMGWCVKLEAGIWLILINEEHPKLMKYCELCELVVTGQQAVTVVKSCIDVVTS